MIDRCITCKHWDVRAARERDRGVCHRVTSFHLTTLAEVGLNVDLGERDIFLLTSPRFGCTLHERIEDAEKAHAMEKMAEVAGWTG